VTAISDAYTWLAHLDSYYQFALTALVFFPLSLLVAGKRSQPPLHKGMLPDALYWLLGPPLVYTPVTVWLFTQLLDAGLYSVDGFGQITDGLVPVLLLPVLLQAVVILLLMDLAQYWVHRLLHGDALWNFHAIHHSAVNVDWLTSARFHPVDTVLRSTCVYLLVAALGFSPEAWLLLVPFNVIYSSLVHANLTWSFGPFHYLLVSPVFHRWHHTYAEEGGDKNFAPTFPFIDVLFGTYYEPQALRPTVFGTPGDPVSNTNIVDQLLYPFAPQERRRVVAGSEVLSNT
jgi:sterol desaturase/sphingolipid hydroxylase (fatty acid hydroxylase superfamily)